MIPPGEVPGGTRAWLDVPPGLDEALSRAADQLRGASSFLVISHFDADGLAACAILSTALDRLGKAHSIRSVPNLGTELAKELLEEEAFLIFVDVGSSLVKELEKRENIILIDHHQTTDDSPLLATNPCAHGFDGSRDACSATMALLLAERLDERNSDLASLALVGILADAQEKRGMSGLNKLVVDQAIVDGLVSEEERLKLMGYGRKSLFGLMIGSHDLRIPGVTGSPKGARRFLEELGIPVEQRGRQTRFDELSEEQRAALLAAGKKASSRAPSTAPFYALPKESGLFIDARQFATLLNACGRLEEAELGIRMCKGEGREKAEGLLRRYSETLKDAYEWQKREAERHQKYRLIDAGRSILPSMIGTICSMVTRGGDVPDGTYVLGLSRNSDGKTTKVSLRVAGFKGADLNGLVTQMMEGVRGESGGHAQAAGAVIATADEDSFLEKAREILGNL